MSAPPTPATLPEEPEIPPGVHSVWIINKSGGLVFRDVYADIAPIDTNETLRLASMWHSMHAIAAQLGPELRGELPSEVGIDPEHGGIECLETDGFHLHCAQTPTGTKLMLTCAPGTFADHDAGQAVLRTVRDLYADYVMKNPFYEAEMPIRCELFEKRLRDAIDAVNGAA